MEHDVLGRIGDIFLYLNLQPDILHLNKCNQEIEKE